MDDKSLYASILGLRDPWGVEKVELRLKDGEVHVWVALPKDTLWVCPDCQDRAPIHDHRERMWRHLDTCQYLTLVHARVPRLDCPNHGVRQVRVPWAEEGSQFTTLFEALTIDWMKEASILAVSKRLRLTWDEAAGIQGRAVKRGLRRRKADPIPSIGIDETAFQRRHEYVSVVTDLERSRVLHVADDRKRDSLDGFWKGLTSEQLASIESVALDMWGPYIDSIRDNLPGAGRKMVFDKFHIAQHAGQAVDQVRREENRALRSKGNDALVGTKYDWLRNPNGFSLGEWREFMHFTRTHSLRTVRAWGLKESLMMLWDYVYPGAAWNHFCKWYRWAMRSRLEPIKRLAAMVRDHWTNIVTYFEHRITNAGSESMNSRIQRIKFIARGFRNRERFKVAIYFHLGGLDLYPEAVRVSQ